MCSEKGQFHQNSKTLIYRIRRQQPSTFQPIKSIRPERTCWNKRQAFLLYILLKRSLADAQT